MKREIKSRIVLHADSFRKWLEEKDPTTEVGVTCSASLCPVAQFVRDTYHPDHVAICGDVHYVYAEPDNWTPIPVQGWWIKPFIQTVDNITNGWRRIPITAAKSLEILDAITK
jgi:hypothetical protein